MQESVLNNDEVFCNVPLHILAPKLTLKCVKNISILHDMFMPSKILLKNAFTSRIIGNDGMVWYGIMMV